MYCVTNSLGLILVYRNNGKNLRTHTLYTVTSILCIQTLNFLCNYLVQEKKSSTSIIEDKTHSLFQHVYIYIFHIEIGHVQSLFSVRCMHQKTRSMT